MTTTYNVRNPGSRLRQTQNCGGIKPVNEILTLHSWVVGSSLSITSKVCESTSHL